MKKIISLVLNNFKNDSRVLKENISLQKAGYNVQVVALWEDGLKEFEIIQNIPVHRIKLKSKNWSKNKLIQLIKYLEFVFRVVKKYKNFDIIHCNDLNTLPIGVIIKKFFNKNVKIVYDAHEYETEINGLKGFQKSLTKILEKSLIKYADKVITVSNSIANEYTKLYNIEKPAVVLNTPLYKEIDKKDIFREKFNLDKDKTIFLYQGGLSSGRGIEILLETFKDIEEGGKREKEEGNFNLQPSTLALQPCIVFMGYGELEQLVKEYATKYENIYFHPAVSPDILLDYTSCANFGVHMAQSHCLSYLYALPNKTFEYIMAELPIIVTNLPELGRLASDNNIGILIEKNTKESFKNAITKAINLDKTQYQELIENIRKAKKKYCWEKQEKILINTYKGVLNVNKI